ncbi:Glycine cleavage H-protein [Trichomonas vaginalis G3]|uniref:Glycine cleavage H-protein n=1 Tax=Trichomonas vaginalis (strain ATCC PRA-98 / G3) TaxID=412133 RepID=A2G8D9_TRIV3|nr:glycine decarboxylation via glycine cleavage system [Trichomonas vaginalis G3]EAX86583.1 Glycine cleavage H-protein [Trichomonas vaginalis G3]KAI5539459.1 glycine decarboxylation via glycine cleavage system [Trichomonas vaginalis G3]|eukprot:XP_001299513.1 Glycine cleavage H-protein [Trichomonas vaginalis G3]
MISTLCNCSRNFTKLYAKTHEYIDVEGTIGKIGLSEFAMKMLGKATFVDVQVGKTFKKSEEFGTVEATKAVTPVQTPVSGKIIEANAAVLDNPELLSKKPETDGWFAKISLSNEAELKELMTKEAYIKYCEGN